METSPSGLSKAERCLRYWAAGYVHGDWEPQTDQKDEGVEGHQQIENHIRYGIPFDDTLIGRAAALGIPHFPTLADLPKIEEPLRVECFGHVFPNQKPDLMWLDVDGPWVIDHKFKGQFSWLLTPQRLKVDLPACLYALGAMRHYGYEHCHLKWLYYKKSEPIAIRPVVTTVYLDQVKAVLRSYVPLLNKMEQVKKLRLPMAEIDYNTKHGCKHFGRPCYVKLKCPEAVA